MPSIARFAASLLAFPLPPRCPGCGTVTEGDHRFCFACWDRLDFLGGPACAQCGAPFEMPVSAGTRCAGCLADPPGYDAVRAAVAYGEIARALALKLKYGGRPGVARTIARAMQRLASDAEGALLVPVPLHRWRMWRRGYNQAQLIARALGNEAGLEVAADALERSRATPVLRGLGPRARARAVAGAFAVPERRRAVVKGRRILLIDDVFTTGATADTCARALKRAGAAEVRLLCWARVIPDAPPR